MQVPKMTAAEPETHLDHICKLDYESPLPNVRLTGIICTIGPASRNIEKIEKLIANGMDIARLNLSHGTVEFHAETIKNIREAARLHSEKLGNVHPVAIALDTKGPEIRTGLIEGGGHIELKKNDLISLTTSLDFADKGKKDIIYIDYPNIVNVVKPGNLIVIDSGSISLIINEISGDTLICSVESGGVLISRRSVHLPGVVTDLPAVTKQDKADLKFGVDNEVDMIFASCIRDADVLKEIRKSLGGKGKNIKIISKIGTLQAIKNLDQIIIASDGILIARGELGIELPPEKVFLAQKAVISRCNKNGKPVICATQMLESMVKRSQADRSEISDVGNSIIDGADAIALTAATSIGEYATETLALLAKICRESEAVIWFRNLFEDLVHRAAGTLDAALGVALSAVEASNKMKASAIIVLTASGRSAHLVARFRPLCPIIMVTRITQTARQAHLYRGILPFVYPEPQIPEWLKDVDLRIHFGLEMGKKIGFVHSGDPVIIVTGWKQGSGFTNTMRILYAFFEDDEIGCVLNEVKRKHRHSHST